MYRLVYLLVCLQRLQRAADTKFLAMLRERQPPITSTSTYAQVEESCGSDPR